MATKIIQGILLDAAKVPLGLATIRFVATSTRSIVNSITTDYLTDSLGNYNISLEHGVYTIQIKRQDEVGFRTVCANAYIASAGVGTIESVIKEQSFIQEVNDTIIAEMLAVLAQTNSAVAIATTKAESATASAATASNAATTAATKASEASASAATATTKANEASTSAANAAASATSVTTSVATATTKANEAITSAASAAASATTATTKVSEASTSAATATTKANEASTSAATATTKASEASTSAANAATSATTATTKASEASTSAASAATSASTATTKASEASTSAANAAASATTATTKATTATASATTATTKASEASTSAASAATSATDAATSATTATTKASEASTSAANAATSATTATTKATNAATSATTATTKASEASTSAANAAASAITASTAVGSANTFATAAATSAQAAKVSADSAVEAKDFVSEQTVLATNAADTAATAASTANSAASASQASATAAEASATVATTKASEASISAASAATTISQVTDKATEAAVSAQSALAAAQEAAISAALAAGALIEAGSVDLSSGIYPTPIKDSQGNNRSCFWKVTVGGAVGVDTYGIGDSLVYSKEISGYYKIDNTESVSSVNGKQGVVVLSKGDLDLSLVDNTSDINKPISTATQTALNSKAPISHVGSVGESAHGLVSQTSAGFMGPADKVKLDNMSGTSGVSSVNEKTGAVVLTKEDLGLGLVNNTSDIDKPISTATQTALATKYSPTNKPTAADVGLGLVDNTSDMNKPISTATQVALATKYSPTNKPTAADIGAAATSHNHSWGEISGVPVTATRWPTAAEVGALPSGDYNPRKDSLTSHGFASGYIHDVDLNTLAAGDTGLYEASSCANSPGTEWGGFFYVETKNIYHTGGSPALLQTAQPYDASGFFWRNYSLNTHSWTEWFKFYDSKNRPTAADVGLGNVNNTSDLDKPISTATQAALATKFSPDNKPTAADVGARPSTWVPNFSDVSSKPTTLSGYGITDAAKTHPPLNFGGSATAITTDDFITQLTNLGAFNSMYWCTKAWWSYAENNYITDTGVGIIQLAGCTVEVIGWATSYTIRIHTSPTVNIEGAVPNAEFVYVNHGSGYSPKWHKIYNTDNKPTAADIGAASSADLSTAISGRVPIASRIDWSSKGVIGCTVGMLSWKNFGNGHTIFDASNGTSPDGTTVDANNSQVAWTGSHPTLMGWNGANTYGVRVDSARAADGAAYANRLNGDVIKTSGQDLTIWDKRAMVGVNDANQLIINYANDWGATLIQGQLYTHALESNRHLVVHNGSTVYGNSGLEVRTTDGSDARIGFHRAGYTGGAINHNAWGFQFERESGGGSRANVAAANFFADAAQDMTGNALTRKDYVDSNLDAKAGIEHVHNVATQAAAGFMSSADKQKLDGLGSGGAAATANTLTTARNINGTPFDGSTDISTANWGTSRTITIGGVAKTVDGSADVSWSNAELGFLPTSGGSLTGPLTISTGALTLSNGPLIIAQGIGSANYFNVLMDSGIATIATQVGVSGFQVRTGSSGAKFLVNESGELYANGVHRVYHTNNKPTAADVGALSTSGTAVAATKLATARTIAGKSFDGTANISITAADVEALSLSGGTLSGGLNVGDAVKLTNSSSMGILNSFGRSIARGSSVAVNVLGNPSDAMYFDGNSLTAWQVRYNSTLYPIYHKGNKPTPAEIGAQPATSDIRVKSNITSLSPVLDKIMLIDPKTFTMEGREGTCVGTLAQDWEVDFPEVILNVPSTLQGEPEILKGIDALGTIGILLKAIQELKAEIEELKNK